MSDNPFKDPVPQPSAGGPYAPPSDGQPQSFPPVAPGALTPILIFCLLFGIAGMLGNCMIGFSTLAMPMIGEMIENAPGLPEEQKVFNRLNIGAQKSSVLPQIVLICVNFVVATMLIIGSIGCLKRKESSRNFLRLGLLAAIIYSVLKLIVYAYSTIAANAALNESIEKYAADPIYEDLKTQVSANSIMLIFSIAIGVVIAIAIMVFYIWARSYLGKKSVEDHFVAINKYRQGS